MACRCRTSSLALFPRQFSARSHSIPVYICPSSLGVLAGERQSACERWSPLQDASWGYFCEEGGEETEHPTEKETATTTASEGGGGRWKRQREDDQRLSRPANPKRGGQPCMTESCSRLETDSARALESIPRIAASSQVPLCALNDVELVGCVEAKEEREAANDDVERRGRPDPGVVEGVDDVERCVAASGSGDDRFETAVGGGGCREGRTRKVSFWVSSCSVRVRRETHQPRTSR